MPRLDFYVNYKLFIKIKLNVESLKIGRSFECDIQLPSPKVSRIHALIQKNGEHFILENASPNGTRINNALVSPSRILEQGDRIYIDDYILIYQPDEATAETLNGDDATTLRYPDIDRKKLDSY